MNDEFSLMPFDKHFVRMVCAANNEYCSKEFNLANLSLFNVNVGDATDVLQDHMTAADHCVNSPS